jgi:hypothetical protein
MSNYNLQMTINAEQLAALKAMGVPMTVSPVKGSSASAAAPGAPKKQKKERDPDAPKREPNSWIKFTQNVREQITAAINQGAGASEQKKAPPKAVLQTASALKEHGLMETATPAQIVAAYHEWLAHPPSPSAAPAAPSAPAAAGGEPSPSKVKKPWSEATKAAAKAKRDATKAAKAEASAAAAAHPAPVEAEEDEDEVQNFKPFLHGGKSYFKNGRGDVLTEQMLWVGHFDGTTLNKKAKKPADLEC